MVQRTNSSHSLNSLFFLINNIINNINFLPFYVLQQAFVLFLSNVFVPPIKIHLHNYFIILNEFVLVWLTFLLFFSEICYSNTFNLLGYLIRKINTNIQNTFKIIILLLNIEFMSFVKSFFTIFIY